MKLTGKYILRDVLGTHFVVPVDRSLGEGRKCFELVDEGAALWRAIEHGKKNLTSIAGEDDVREFISVLKELGALE